MNWYINFVFLVTTCRAGFDITIEEFGEEEDLSTESFAFIDEPVVFFNTVNRCTQDLWIGAIGISNSRPSFRYHGLNYYTPNQGGWYLPAGESANISVPYDWKAGRFWARTGCTGTPDRDFHCETGDCGPWIECSTGNVPRSGDRPATLAEFTLNVNDNDHYDISLVDGFNVPMKISSTSYNETCINPECLVDLNNICPCVLSVKGTNGTIIGCDSACTKFNTNEYCCLPPCCGTPLTCNPDNWPVNYAHFFKSNCPQANSYAFDNIASVFLANSFGFDKTVSLIEEGYRGIFHDIYSHVISDLTSHTFSCSNTNYDIYFC